MRQRSRV